MRIGRAESRQKALCVVFAELYYFAGEKVLRADYFVCACCEILCAFLLSAGKNGNEPVGYIVNVGGTCFHIIIIHCGEDFRKVVGCKRYCIFGVDTLGRDYASDGIAEIVVKRQNHMYIEYFRKLFSDLAHCCVTQLVQLFKSCLLCRSEPTCFIFCAWRMYAAYGGDFSFKLECLSAYCKCVQAFTA